VNIHPELGLRLAQTKIEEARSRSQRASLLRAASTDQGSSVTETKRRDRWAALLLATVSRSRVPRRSLRAKHPADNAGLSYRSLIGDSHVSGPSPCRRQDSNLRPSE
jgi:hypothetical protein